MSVAFLFPGQGEQYPDMLAALPEAPAVERTRAEAQAVLGDLRLLDAAAALKSTTSAQLALLIAGVACARALTEDYGAVPDFVAGHSVGAFAAAVTAGVLTFAEALGAVRLRGELMQQTAQDGRWGMAALVGLRLPAVRALVQSTATDQDPLWIANINAADQVTLSGTNTALRRAAHAAARAGAQRLERLDVAVASHCPLQQRTVEALTGHLSALPRRPQRIPYLSNTRGRRLQHDPDAVLDDLARSAGQPVQWYDAMRLMAELGGTRAVQMQPGHVLCALLQRIEPDIPTAALEQTPLAQAAFFTRQTPGAQ